MLWFTLRKCRGDKLDMDRRLSQTSDIIFDAHYRKSDLNSGQISAGGGALQNRKLSSQKNNGLTNNKQNNKLRQENLPSSLNMPKITTKNESWRYSLNYEDGNLFDKRPEAAFDSSNMHQK